MLFNAVLVSSVQKSKLALHEHISPSSLGHRGALSFLSYI